jgi:hypothetical protein
MWSPTKTGSSAAAYMSNSFAALALLVIGYPLAHEAIRTMLVGWIMMAVGITQFIFGHHFQTTGTAVTPRTVPIRSTDRERYR